MDIAETVKVKPWGAGQGAFVVIDKADLTAEHQLYDDTPEPEPEPEPIRARVRAPRSRKTPAGS